ncbi:hypothetical protein R5R35_012212 [Gryllus longicercus]|uniref:Uncharacterized protein n=1 Tax=Gryllus longicercus TaxID=2509291 RepID=A0AAN9VTS6_9ORTH
MQQRPSRLAAAGSRAAPVAAAAAATADVHRHPLQPPPAPAPVPGPRPQAAHAPPGPAPAAPLAHAHAHATAPAADLKRTVSIGELHAAAPGPDARLAALRGRAPKPRYYSQEMLSSAGSSTESSGCTESSSKTSLHSAESTEARARPAPCPTPAPTSASASLFFRSEREHLGLRPHAPALRPFVARPAPLRPASLADRQASALAKGPSKDQGTLKKPKKDARRAEIVAAVTKRLYTTKKKAEASTDEAPTPEPSAAAPASASGAADDEEEPEELKLCARARAKLQELSRRALGTGGRRARPPLADADVQTDFPRHTTRVKEKAVETDPRTLCVADVAVGTRDSPPRVLRVREVGTGPEGVDASVGTRASPTHAPSAHSSPPPQPLTKDANVQLDSAASQSSEGERRKFDSNCFDCYLQSAAEGVSSDGPYILSYQGTKTKSNQCNLFDGLQESKEVAVGVIPHATAVPPDWVGQNQSRDVAVCTDKCFYHTQLQKYAGVTAIPSPTVQTSGSDALSSNNYPVYSCATERTTQLPIRDRLTNNIHGGKEKEEIKCRLPGYLKTFRPHLSPTDTYTMRKSLGTQTLSNRLGNIHFSRESPHKWQASDYISSSHVPKKYKNFENQMSRTEHCCHTFPNNLLYKQIDECFSDDSLDSCKSGDYCLEPDSLNDIQTCDSFNQYRYNCLSRKDRLPNSFCTNSSHICPVHNKVIHCMPHSRRQRVHHNNASRVDLPSFHSCNSINKHRDGKLQVDLGLERCNIHREDRTCEKHPRKLRQRREHRDTYEYEREDVLGKMNNTYPIFMSSNSPSKSTTFPHTQMLETNSNLRSWSNLDPTKPVVNIQSVSAQSQQNIPTRAQDEINTKQYFTVNETPLYTFTKCNSGYMAKEVTSLTMSPINFQLTTSHFQATQTMQRENEIDRHAQTESHEKNSNTTLKKKLNDEPQPSPTNISALLCAECSEKISSFTEDAENKSLFPNAQNSNLTENDISITEKNSNSFSRCNSKEAVMHDIKIKEKSISKDSSFHDIRENLFTSKESVLPANTINLSHEDLPSNITRNKSETISICNHNSQQKADLYSIIAYNQTYDHLNISSHIDPLEETNDAQKEKISFSPENITSFKKNNSVHNQDEKSHSVLTSLQQIKECIQRIENNISKYYQTEIDAESSHSETPTEITAKWVFNKTLQTNDVSVSKESEACRFETLITLNKHADITPNWKGHLKVSKVSSIKMSNDAKGQEDSSNQYVHVKNDTDTIDDNSKLGTYTGDEQKDTNIGIEIEINDTQLKTGSITFGKNYTSFDTKVQNFKLLLMLCGNLINIQSPISMQHIKETQQPHFPENTVITFTFEDGGYQPLQNVVVKQSISQGIAHDMFEGKKSGLTTQDEENGDLKPSAKENDISGHKSDDKKKIISNETGINLLPSSLSDKLNCPLSNHVKTNSVECALAKPHVQITSNTARSTDESLIAGSASDNGIINTQPSINGDSIINHKCSNSKTKHTKAFTEGKPNVFNALFLKKSIKRKKRCTPLSPSSCMWNFTDRQSLQEESDTTTSRTCSTLSTFIKKANSLLTRLNEVSTMLDKNKKKSDSDTSVLVTDQNPGQSDEEVDKLQVTSELLSNYSKPVEELANKPIATISKNYHSIPSNQTLSRNKLHPKLSSSLLSEISCSENNSQRSLDTVSVPYNSPVYQNKSTPLLSFKDYEIENNDSEQASISSRELNGNEEQKQQKKENQNICSHQLSESQPYISNIPFTNITNENKSQLNYNALSTSVDSDIRSNVLCERNQFNHRQDKLNSYHCKTNDSCSCNSQLSTACGRIWHKMCSSAESLPHRNVETSYIPKTKIRNNYQVCNQHCFSLSSQTYAGNELNTVPNDFCTSTHSMHVPRNIVISEQSKYNHEKSKSFPAHGSYKPSLISRSCHSHFSSDTNNSLVSGKYLSNQSCSFTNYTKPQKLSTEYTSKSEHDTTQYISGINRTHIKSKMINTPVYRNTSQCPTCINLQNTNVVPSDNKTAISNTKKVVRGKSVVPSTDIVHSSGYISSILPSPRAYMQYLLHLRRQIVVASGLDTNFNYSSFTQNDV